MHAMSHTNSESAVALQNVDAVLIPCPEFSFEVSPMKTVRIGVIGVGTMGQRHCRVYSNLRHARLVGVLDAISQPLG